MGATMKFKPLSLDSIDFDNEAEPDALTRSGPDRWRQDLAGAAPGHRYVEEFIDDSR